MYIQSLFYKKIRKKIIELKIVIFTAIETHCILHRYVSLIRTPGELWENQEPWFTGHVVLPLRPAAEAPTYL